MGWSSTVRDCTGQDGALPGHLNTPAHRASSSPSPGSYSTPSPQGQDGLNATRVGTTREKSSQGSLRSPGQPRAEVKRQRLGCQESPPGTRSGTFELEGPAAGRALSFSLRCAVRGPPSPPYAASARLSSCPASLPLPASSPRRAQAPPPGPPQGQGLV